MYTEQKSFDGKVNLIDVTSQEFLENPYKFYKERREVSTIIEIHENVYSIGSYDLIEKLLSHPNLGRAFDGTLEPNEELQRINEANPILKVLQDWMLFKNPPDHTRIRKLVLKAFTPKMIRELEPMMKDQMEKLVQQIKDGTDNTFDLVSSISYPFPVSIISHMMGIPEEDREKFKRWSNDFAIALAMDVTNLPEEVRNRLNQSASDLIAYFEDLIEKKKEQDGDDLVSTLIRAELDDDQLSISEILSNCALLLVAGHETTTSLISNGINLLLEYPDQLEILKAKPELIPNFVEEVLRFDPPVQSVGRFVMEDTEIDGLEFKRGYFVSFILAGAGRDPEANPDPETFKVDRENIKHIAFAKGIHYCLGANLARKEAAIAFETLISEFPDMKRAGEAIRNPNHLLRGFKNLPIEY